MDDRVHDGGLAKDESRRRVDLDLVDALVDDQVARYAERTKRSTPV